MVSHQNRDGIFIRGSVHETSRVQFSSFLFSKTKPNSVMAHLFSMPYTGSQLKKKGLISNSLHFAINLWMILPLPTSQTFFTFTLLLGSSVLLQTPECQNTTSSHKVVSASSLKKAPTTWNKLPPSIRHVSSVSFFKSSLKASFRKHFLQSPCPEVHVCVKVFSYFFLFPLKKF